MTRSNATVAVAAPSLRPAGAPRGLREHLVPALILLVAVLALGWSTWSPLVTKRQVFGWDALWEYWGDLQFQIDAWRAGEVPLWNPFDRLGYPFHADPQAGVLYPVNWLLGLLSLGLGGVPVELMTVKTLLHFYWAALGAYALLRIGRGLPRWAAVTGGVALLLGFAIPYNLFSALNWSFAWAPWVLLALTSWAARPSAARAAGVAVTAGMTLLAGAYATVFYTALVAVPYGAWLLVHHVRAAADRRAHLVALARTLPWLVGILVALTFAQLWATAGLVPETVREVRDHAFITGGSLTAGELVGLLLPRWPSFLAPYLGAPMLLAALAAVALRPEPRRLVLLACLLFAVACAATSVTGLLPPLAEIAPPFGFFRRPHRYLYVAALVIAILGAEGLAELARLEPTRRRRALIALAGVAGVVVMVCLAGWVPQDGKPAATFASTLRWGLLVWPTALALALGLMLAPPRARVVVGWCLPALVAADLLAAHATNIKRGLRAHPVARHDGLPRRLPGVPDEVRLYDRELLDYRPGLRLQIRDLGGYEGDPLALSRYARALELAKQQPVFLGHLNVRWLTQSNAHPISTRGLTPAAEAYQKGVFEVPAVAPRAQWIGGATLVDGGPAAALKRLAAAPPGTLAVVERELAPAGLPIAGNASAPPVTGRVVEAHRGGLTVEIDAPAPGVLVIAEAYAPGWEARVDGTLAAIFPVNGVLRGVAVDAGQHRVVLAYPARGYLALAVGVPLGLLAALLLMVRARRAAKSI